MENNPLLYACFEDLNDQISQRLNVLQSVENKLNA